MITPMPQNVFLDQRLQVGVNYYFHWEKAYQGDCTINTYENHKCISSMKRALREKDSDILIRYNEGIEILKKIKRSKNLVLTNLSVQMTLLVLM